MPKATFNVKNLNVGIIVNCKLCRQQLMEPGAIVLSPPDKSGNCIKLHLCVDCWERFLIGHPKIKI